jgi:hypothetical protein
VGEEQIERPEHSQARNVSGSPKEDRSGSACEVGEVEEGCIGLESNQRVLPVPGFKNLTKRSTP